MLMVSRACAVSASSRALARSASTSAPWVTLMAPPVGRCSSWRAGAGQGQAGRGGRFRFLARGRARGWRDRTAGAERAGRGGDSRSGERRVGKEGGGQGGRGERQKKGAEEKGRVR